VFDNVVKKDMIDQTGMGISTMVIIEKSGRIISIGRIGINSQCILEKVVIIIIFQQIKTDFNIK